MSLDYHNWVQYLDLAPGWVNPLATIFLWVCSIEGQGFFYVDLFAHSIYFFIEI